MKQLRMILGLLIKALFGTSKNIKPVAETNGAYWKDIEYFNDVWIKRIALMAKYIPHNSSVVDFGCGPMWLKELLPKGCTYTGVDYIYRGAGSEVFDLNMAEFPDKKFDVAFVSGCLEYIVNYKWFINQLDSHCNLCILSYCTLEFFDNVEERKKLAWVNHVKRDEILGLFSNLNWQLISENITETNNSIFIFEKTKKG